MWGKVTMVGRGGVARQVETETNVEIMEDATLLTFLGSYFSDVGGTEDDVKMRVDKGLKTTDMKKMCNVRSLHLSVKRKLYETSIIPTVMHTTDTWSMREQEQHILDVMEM